MVKTGTLHFKIGSGLSELIRDAFWYEQRFDWAKETLRCFRGITVEQMDDILRGDAHFEPIDGGSRVLLVFKEDEKFKKDLAERMEFVKKRIEGLHKEIYNLEKVGDKVKYGYFQDETVARSTLIEIEKKKLAEKIDAFARVLEYYDELFAKKVIPELTTRVGEYEVPNNLLDEYINEVVRRIRMSIKTGSLIYENPIAMLGLEQRRKVLHDRIIEAVGLDKADRGGDKYQEFARALEEFLEDMGAGL